MAGRPRVIVVGAGFGGLTVVRRLKRAPVDVLLLDRNNYHLFTPLLYEVASSLLNPSEIAQPVRALLRGIPNADFHMTLVEGLDLDGRRVLTAAGALEYDYLVLAVGSVSNYFGSAALEAATFGLKDLDQGLALRNRIMRQFEMARWETDPDRRRTLLTFAIVGGGPTGIEFAGALSELVHLVLRKDFVHLDLTQVRIVLVEGSPELLGAFRPRLREHARRTLAAKGIQVLTGTRVESLRGTTLALDGGRRLEAGTVIWTAGVKANVLGAATGTPTGRAGTIGVGPTLQVPDHSEVFAIGDLAAVAQDGSPLPQLAPVAMQQAECAAANVEALVRGKPLREFRYRDKGIMATIGRNAGVVQSGPLELWGWPGWVAWLFLHLILIVSLRSKLVVLINWTWDYVFYDRPVRLILESRRDNAATPVGEGSVSSDSSDSRARGRRQRVQPHR